MKVRYREELANHSDPESCACHREVVGEALTGEIDRPAIEPRNNQIRDADAVSEAEGHMGRNAYASCDSILRGRRT